MEKLIDIILLGLFVLINMVLIITILAGDFNHFESVVIMLLYLIMFKTWIKPYNG